MIVEIIKMLKLHWKFPHPILVTAHTNAAVDNLVDGLDRAGLKVLRMGAQERVRADLAHLSMERKMEDHPLFAVCEDLRRQKDSYQVDVARYDREIRRLDAKKKEAKLTPGEDKELKSLPFLIGMCFPCSAAKISFSNELQRTDQQSMRKPPKRRRGKGCIRKCSR